MGFFNEIDEIAKRQEMKSELGDNRIFGVMMGIVTNNYNHDYPGRVCVQIHLRDQEANVLKWARIAMPYIGKKWGTYFVPEVGDQVLVVFEDGNIEKPFVIGCVPTADSTFTAGRADEKNRIKSITTKNGNEITVTDESEGEGEKDKIEIRTAKNMFGILLDNENHKAVLSDKEKENVISMNTQSGEIGVKAEKKIQIKAGDIEISVNGDSGRISVKCKKLKLTADDNIKIESGGMHKVQAENVMLSANSSFKASSSGTAAVEGSVIKMG